MLYQTLKFIVEELNNHLGPLRTPSENLPDKLVLLGSMAHPDNSKPVHPNNILLTLVNITEEPALKNIHFNPHIHTKPNLYENLPLGLNLQLVFAACMTDYELSLVYISHIIGFFRTKSIFTHHNSPSKTNFIPETMSIILDFQTLTIEEMNQIWSIMGGKHHPFICYRLRLQSAS